MTTIFQTIEEVTGQFNLRLNRGTCELTRLHSDRGVFFFTAPGPPAQPVPVVSKAKYFGMIVSEDGKPSRNLTDRINEGAVAMRTLTRFWRHSYLSQRRNQHNQFDEYRQPRSMHS